MFAISGMISNCNKTIINILIGIFVKGMFYKMAILFFLLTLQGSHSGCVHWSNVYYYIYFIHDAYTCSNSIFTLFISIYMCVNSCVNFWELYILLVLVCIILCTSYNYTLVIVINTSTLISCHCVYTWVGVPLAIVTGCIDMNSLVHQFDSLMLGVLFL